MENEALKGRVPSRKLFTSHILLSLEAMNLGPEEAAVNFTYSLVLLISRAAPSTGIHCDDGNILSELST